MNQRGQAVIEYILLLVVIVSLVTLASVRLFKPFQNYFNSIGNYVGCLLEFGELPSLGSETTVQFQENIKDATNASGKSCKPQFVTGNSSNSNNGSNGGGSSGSNGGDSQNEDGDSSKSSAKNKRTSSGDGSEGNSGSNYSDNMRVNGNFFNNKKKRIIKKASIGTDGANESAFSTNVNGFSRNRGDTFNAKQKKTNVNSEFKGYLSNKSLKDKKVEIVTKNILPSNDGENGAIAKKKFKVKSPERMLTSEEKEEEFNLSILFKYFMIAGIAILIFVIIGGQALQISKNMEK